MVLCQANVLADIRSTWDIAPPPPPEPSVLPGVKGPPAALMKALATAKALSDPKHFPPPPGLKLGDKLNERKMNAHARTGTLLSEVNEEALANVARGKGGKGYKIPRTRPQLEVIEGDRLDVAAVEEEEEEEKKAKRA